MVPYLKRALSNLFRPAVTEKFPAGEPPKAAEGYRGRISYDPTLCINCGMCMRVCAPQCMTRTIKPLEGGAQAFQTKGLFGRRRKIHHHASKAPAGALGLDVPGQLFRLAEGKPGRFVQPHQPTPCRKLQLRPLQAAGFADAVIQTHAGQARPLCLCCIGSGHRQKYLGFFQHCHLTSCNLSRNCDTIS